MSRTTAIPAALGALIVAAMIAALAVAVPARAQEPAAEVDVFNFDYSPKEVTVEVGQTVRWTGTGGNHTVTADDMAFDSGGFGPGATFEQTFDEAGTFEYYCRFHSSADADPANNQNGVVTVVAAGEAPTEEPTEAPTDEPTEQPTEAPADGDPADVDGTDPVATALSWSALLPDGGTTTAFIGTAGNFPDSLASGPGQGILDAPLLLTPTDELDEAVAAELTRLGVTRVIILGGPAAISTEVETALGQVDGIETVDRAEGADRRETARAVADLVAPDASTIILARQDGEGTAAFADSLATGAVGASNGWPVVLVASTVDDALAAWLQQRMPDQIIIAGGTAAVPQAVEDRLIADGYDVQRFSGPTRTSTASALYALRSTEDVNSPRVIVDGFSDLAWASGFAAALHGQGGLLLARSTSPALPGDTAGSLQASGADVLCGPTLADETCRQADLMAEAEFTDSLPGALFAVMDNAQEVSAAEEVDANGMINLYPVGDDAFCGIAFVSEMSGPLTVAHIHAGSFGEAGPPALDLLLSASQFGDYYGCTAESDTTQADVVANPDGFYVNLHTALNPAGEVRGQLFAKGDDLQAILSGENETGEGDPDGMGVAVVYDTGVADQICTRLTVADLSAPVTAAHIHPGEAGTDGPPLFTISSSSAETTYGCSRGNDADAVADVFANPANYYANVHTSDFGPGAIRGQLEPVLAG